MAYEKLRLNKQSIIQLTSKPPVEGLRLRLKHSDTPGLICKGRRYV